MYVYGHVRAGGDPEMSQTKNGTTVAKFSGAEKIFVNGQEGTAWHTITAFGKLAERIEKCVRKGQMLLVNGYGSSNEYTTKDGEKRFSSNILLSDFDLCGGGGKKSDNAQTDQPAQSSQQNTSAPAPAGQMPLPEGMDEELPFQ